MATVFETVRRNIPSVDWLGPITALVAIAGLIVSALPGVAADNIGVSSTVVREVTGNHGGRTRPLAVGSGVFRDETIATGSRSNAQLLFLDETSLNIGPQSRVVLDSFVYSGGGRASEVTVELTRGALRFVSGSSRPQSYKIKTPVATIGVRGTILDIFVLSRLAIVILEEGASDVCIAARCVGLVRRGTYLVVHAGGRIEGPKRWDGGLRRLIGPVSFPLYGWHLQLDELPRYFHDPSRDDADQIERRDEIRNVEPVQQPQAEPIVEPVPEPVVPEPVPEPVVVPAPIEVPETVVEQVPAVEEVQEPVVEQVTPPETTPTDTITTTDPQTPITAPTTPGTGGNSITSP